MYKPDMTLPFQNKLRVNTLSPKPGVTIWYSQIPIIIHSIFSKGTYHNFRPMVNEIFQKDDFIKPIFSDREINAINGFKALKKQLEWICGRVLVKHMIQHVFLKDTPLDQISLSYLEKGAPFVSGYPDIPVSLSHSNAYTIAVCSRNKGQTLGIDIEKIAKKPDQNFLKTAFTQNEILNFKDDAADIFKHWTIKEAYLKYIKKGFNESLHNVEVLNRQIFHGNKKISVDIYSQRIEQDYIFSFVSD